MFVYVSITRANMGKPHWGNEGSTNLLSRKFLVFFGFSFFLSFSLLLPGWFLLEQGSIIFFLHFNSDRDGKV